ncbi:MULTISPECIES: hypothetical protein [Pimelobacter]|uniref:hypothetical protein n=1 Tax=Pimelobacter TaxID=2044 RepID=UPI001C054A3F|nr:MULTISPECIES: hypothetical protein [Pimelobacter]MBU2698850.1 hypothetical protein [Pimelobacter sp. 30-1]UUW93040.1 hypothetical protein M0M43_30570 [Pimelobacter simplex]UUW99072.1 hypothetical protein M0M48_30590 [Pimelobacter simplex]
MPQPHRGERVLLGTRVPEDMGEAVKAVAKRKGFRSVSDYLLVLAAQDINYDIADPRDVHAHPELPLTG